VYQANFQRVWDLACADERLFAALGLHPVYLDQHRPEHLVQLREWLERLRGDPRLCAVGEFGLDYYLETWTKRASRRCSKRNCNGLRLRTAGPVACAAAMPR
jgi:TatD DNase family protein